MELLVLTILKESHTQTMRLLATFFYGSSRPSTGHRSHRFCLNGHWCNHPNTLTTACQNQTHPEKFFFIIAYIPLLKASPEFLSYRSLRDQNPQNNPSFQVQVDFEASTNHTCQDPLSSIVCWKPWVYIINFITDSWLWWNPLVSIKYLYLVTVRS